LKKILTNFFVLEVFNKKMYAFDDNLSVTHVFIKQIFRAVELTPPFPPPPWGRSGSFHPQAAAFVIAMRQ
jgi:hypothetical protein